MDYPKMQILEKSTCILDSMKTQSRDERPKTVDKLKNVLWKITDICYVSSVLNVIFKHGKLEELMISDVDEVRKSDKELDKEIASFVLKWAETQNRRVLVLPCDSNLHIEVASNIEDWYRNKDQRYHVDKPFDEIAKASCKDYDLESEDMLIELTRHGYLILNNSSVRYTLPSQDVQDELEKAFNRFQTKISESLEVLSARSREFFSREIIEANKILQEHSADKIRHYCEQQYAMKYSLYRKSSNGNAIGEVTRQLRGTSVDSSTIGETVDESMDVDQNEDMDTLPDGKVETIPITLTCEAALVMIQLFKTPSKPSTISDFHKFVQDRCSVIYVVSPKYILSNIVKEDRDLPRNFEFNILLGQTITKKPMKLGDMNELAKLLKFPGKDKVQQSSLLDRRFHRYRHEPMDTGSGPDTRRSIFRGFQKYVSDSVKSKTERHRSVPVMMDKDAEIRCRDRLRRWIDDARSNPNKRVTIDTLSKELIELSFEFTKMPVEELIQLLINSGYLNRKENGTIEYKPFYRRSMRKASTQDFVRFQQYWEEDYQPEDKDSLDLPDTLLSRKRRLVGTVPDANAKKQRVIDI